MGKHMARGSKDTWQQGHLNAWCAGMFTCACAAATMGQLRLCCACAVKPLTARLEGVQAPLCKYGAGGLPWMWRHAL